MSLPIRIWEGGATPELHAPEVRLRHLAEADTTFLFSLFQEEQTASSSGLEAMKTLDEAWDLYKQWANMTRSGTGIRWVIETADGHAAGTLGFRKSAIGLAEIGYELLPQWRGKGLMRKSLELALQWAEENLSAQFVEACVLPDNERSISLLKKFSFAYDHREYVQVSNGRKIAQVWIRPLHMASTASVDR